MKALLTSPPVPEDTDVLWSHSTVHSVKRPQRSDGLKKLTYWGGIGFYLLVIVFWLTLIWSRLPEYLNSPSILLNDLGSFFFPMAVMLALLLTMLRLKAHLRKTSTIKSAASGIPVWLSKTHLGFEPAHNVDINLIALQDIKSISSSFSEGAPAILLDLPKHSFTLISSEANQLLRHLFSLRPDLEITP